MAEARKPPPITAREEAFIDALMGEDELGMVVRAHIHIEARVNDLLEVLVVDPEYLPRLRYEQRARLACALGLHPDQFASLKVLGDIRNRFGHKLDTKLTAAMVDELHDALPKDDRDTMMEAHAMTRAQHPHVPSDYSGLKPKDRFVLLAVSLDRALAKAYEEAKEIRRRRQEAAR